MERSKITESILDSKLLRVKVFAFDVDGVFTDGMVRLQHGGIYERAYHTRDGFATQYAVSKGFYVWILTGGIDESIRVRFSKLHVEEIHLGQKNKLATLVQLTNQYGTSLDSICYMGDDIPDLSAMKQCGLGACPKDACQDIQDISHYISPHAGGKGCVRDIVERTMRTQGKWLLEDTQQST